MWRLFHQTVNVDEIAPSQPLLRSRSKSNTDAQHGYAPMTLPGVTYDDFVRELSLHSNHAADSTSRETSMDADAHRRRERMHRAKRPLVGLLQRKGEEDRVVRQAPDDARQRTVPLKATERRRSESPSKRVVTSVERVASLSAASRRQPRDATRSPSDLPLDASSRLVSIRRSTEDWPEASKRGTAPTPHEVPRGRSTAPVERQYTPAHPQRHAAVDHHIEAPGRTKLRALIRGLRLRAKLSGKFALDIRQQIRESQQWKREAEEGNDALFSAAAMDRQIALLRSQLAVYLRNDEVVMPINLRRLPTRTQQLQQRALSVPAARPAVEDEHGTTRLADADAERDDDDEQVSPTPAAKPRTFKMLKRGAGLKRYFGDAPPPTGEPEHDGADARPAADALTGTARLAALAAPKHVTAPAPAAVRSQSASGPTRGAAAAPKRASSSSAREPSRERTSPERHKPPAPPVQHGDPERRAVERQMSAAMAVPLAPDLTALLSPTSGYEPWTLEYCLRRPAGYKRIAGLLANATAARELLGPHVRSGREFNQLIDNLTGLL
jgi:hypothetical protein